MPTEDGISVAANVRAELARRGLHQIDIAPVIGASRTGVSRRLSGDQEFSISELRAVARFFDVDLTVLLGDPEPATARGT